MPQNKQLACAVLEQALLDIENMNNKKCSTFTKVDVEKAISFIFDENQPMFQFWCDAAGFQPWVVRRAARMRLSKFGYDMSMVNNVPGGVQAQ